MTSHSLMRDTMIPASQRLTEQRLDETETGAGATVTLVDASGSPAYVGQTSPADVDMCLRLHPAAAGLVAREVVAAVLDSGEVILLLTRTRQEAADRHVGTQFLPSGARLRGFAWCDAAAKPGCARMQVSLHPG